MSEWEPRPKKPLMTDYFEDDTTTLYEKCEHGRLESHPNISYGDVPVEDNCPGGRERTFQIWGHVQYDGPALDLVMDDEDWDVELWVEVSDGNG